ncbi:PadR family transcriptional regulator [Streptococcus sp. DD13]|uniref:PadR family transcriptional regulator n=1 Tax=Streptococcus sp. DD13 TaxID=1777881 RepID=UPI000799AD19|nr:PadR family transcriptional regulator [Streptococcus sp. DD13]KXT78300.1 Transcriptional regulator, PadR family [Streptococcus sp. DD13]
MRESQLLKGVLDGCVLEIIAKQEIYGYELVQRLREAGFSTTTGGTIYPLLQKLEKNQLVQVHYKPSSDGPDRKYFTITGKGKDYLHLFWQQWDDLVQKVDRLEKGES